MKKILVAVLLVIITLLNLTSCALPANGDIADCVKYVKAQYANFEIIDQDRGQGWTVLYDKNTKVLYLILDGYQSTGMMPILNADGSPKLYVGE